MHIVQVTKIVYPKAGIEMQRRNFVPALLILVSCLVFSSMAGANIHALRVTQNGPSKSTVMMVAAYGQPHSTGRLAATQTWIVGIATLWNDMTNTMQEPGRLLLLGSGLILVCVTARRKLGSEQRQ